MTGAHAAAPGRTAAKPARRLPPIAPLAVASMTCVIAGGIYVAAHLPHPTPLGPAIELLAAASVLVGLNVISLIRLDAFAWDTFFLVGGWALVAYVVVAGMLEYVSACAAGAR